MLIAAAALLLPGSALASGRIAVGDVAGNTSPEASFAFDVFGKFNKKGKFVPREASGFEVTVDFNCWDAAGNLLSTTRRSDLPFGLMNAAKVGKRGGFHTAALLDGGSRSVAVLGTFRKGKATGTVGAVEGSATTPPGAHCSTGTFTDPAIAWTARLISPVCGSAAERSRCIAPPVRR